MTLKARRIYLNGIVQGVGFRPFVYKLAQEMNITGWVNNTSHGVNIHAEGENLDLFYKRLITEAPALARIISKRWEEAELENYQEFTIIHSEEDFNPDVLISPDVATCPDCLEDIYREGDRRYHYPFTNCTNCGPRYTIIKKVPYDRVYTTMAEFPMCPECAEEYHNPSDRRFHAQPVACNKCGPQVRLLDERGSELEGLGIELLEAGYILAVKGLGGFHLVCDATNREAVERLRARKERGAKPFALMARNMEKIKEELVVSEQEQALLESNAAPIVILDRKPVKSRLPEEIAPGLHTLGVMLPYTPLHHLLFQGKYDFLVVTSANLSGQPLIYRNEDALNKLKGIADYFLIHNRDIYHPCDDSVVQVMGGEPVFHRRARGYVPLPIFTSTFIKSPMLGVGGELKNAFALAHGERVFLSQYIGDIENYENYQRFVQEVNSFQDVVNIRPEKIVHDAHPNYQTTRYALNSPLPKTSVQHHHAHMVSVMGEHDMKGEALGVVCDGTGYGTDGKIWGFEFLYGGPSGFKRVGHLQYLPLPGGDAGAKHPLRIAYAYIKSLFTPKEWEKTNGLWDGLSQEEKQILNRQLVRGYQIFPTSSTGRLFDAVSALLDVCVRVTYEGQAAIELESTAARWVQKSGGMDKVLVKPYPLEISRQDDKLVIMVKDMFMGIVDDMLINKEKGEIAYRFHLTVAEMIVQTVKQLNMGNGSFIISGGVFQNKLLTEILLKRCKDLSLHVIRHKDLPPGDGGIALGQILIGNEVL